jgi:putative hydrolase of the HAD superfamily
MVSLAEFKSKEYGEQLIKNIIFDLGNVLVNVEPERFKKGLISEGITEEKYEYFYQQWRRHNSIHQFETGRISQSEFLDFSLNILDCKLNKAKLISHFNKMLVKRNFMKRFLQNFISKNNHNLFLLSNTNPIHWSYVRKEFDYVNLIKHRALSYKLGYYKPDPQIYKKVLRLYNIEPAETLFIDDSSENCESAKTVGIKTIQYKDFKSFKKELKNFL